jgi:hypothetical protein
VPIGGSSSIPSLHVELPPELLRQLSSIPPHLRRQFDHIQIDPSLITPPNGQARFDDYGIDGLIATLNRNWDYLESFFENNTADIYTSLPDTALDPNQCSRGRAVKYFAPCLAAGTVVDGVALTAEDPRVLPVTMVDRATFTLANELSYTFNNEQIEVGAYNLFHPVVTDVPTADGGTETLKVRQLELFSGRRGAIKFTVLEYYPADATRFNYENLEFINYVLDYYAGSGIQVQLAFTKSNQSRRWLQGWYRHRWVRRGEDPYRISWTPWRQSDSSDKIDCPHRWHLTQVRGLNTFVRRKMFDPLGRSAVSTAQEHLYYFPDRPWGDPSQPRVEYYGTYSCPTPLGF